MESIKHSMVTIKQFAQLTGLSQRVLRHYHEIELLIPEYINHKAYRFYGSKNLETAQQILVFKELGFTLKEIIEIIYAKNFNKKEALQSQKTLLELKRQRLNRILAFIDELITKGDINMNDKLKQAFDNKEIDNKLEEYTKEAKEKWGSSESYKQSQHRLKKYSKEDIETINGQQAKIYQQLVLLMSNGTTDKEVQELVHQARLFISKYWYDCSFETFAGLGHMYLADDRFKGHLDQYGDGFAEFFSDAIKVYCQKK
jgi:DNA-binding transcriptional MerR regulator